MKTLKESILVLTFCITMFSVKCNAQEIDVSTFRKLGMVSQMVEIKYVSEAYLKKGLSEKEADTPTIYRNYNLVRIDMYRIIYQLIADINTSNSIGTYNKLDRFCRKNADGKATKKSTKIKPYIDSYEILFRDYAHILPKKTGAGGNKSMFGVADIDLVALGTLVETIWKDIQDIRQHKVEGITDILKNLLPEPVENSK